MTGRHRRRSWPWLLAALLAWHLAERRKDDDRRVKESRYDLTRYRPR